MYVGHEDEMKEEYLPRVDTIWDIYAGGEKAPLPQRYLVHPGYGERGWQITPVDGRRV